MWRSMIKKQYKILFLLPALALVQVFSPALQAKEAFHYESLGRRDPFVPLVGVSASSGSAGALGIMTIDDVVLGGIMTDAFGKRSVVINGEILDEGQGVGRLYIEEIGKNEVSIRIDDVKYELELYE